MTARRSSELRSARGIALGPLQVHSADDLLSQLTGLFPLTVHGIEERALNASLLADIPLRPLSLAVDRWIKTKARRPTPGDLRRMIAIEALRLPKPEDAWGQVVTALNRLGSDMKVRPKWMHPIVWDICQALNWSALCRTTNTISDRAQFLTAYREAVEEAVDDAAASAGAGVLEVGHGARPTD